MQTLRELAHVYSRKDVALSLVETHRDVLLAELEDLGIPPHSRSTDERYMYRALLALRKGDAEAFLFWFSPELVESS